MSAGKLTKDDGSFYTPRRVVEMMLDLSGWGSSRVPSGGIIDPACGDGAILVIALDRLLTSMASSGASGDDMRRSAVNKVHGIEIDGNEAQKARRRLTEVSKRHGIDILPDEFDIVTGDAFEMCRQRDMRFSHIVGNPPYIRENGTDAYYRFYDLGIGLMPNDGSLVFLSPSTWFTNKNGKALRRRLMMDGSLSDVIDFRHYQVFAPYALTYTAIVRIDRRRHDTIRWHAFDEETATITGTEDMPSDECWVNGLFSPHSPRWLPDIYKAAGPVRVMNGYQTSANGIYITRASRDTGMEIPCVKLSTGERGWVLYPYREDGTLIGIDEIHERFPKASVILDEHHDELEERSHVTDADWWGFSRSQGISDTYRDKVSVPTIVKPHTRVIVTDVPAGTGGYGGCYAIGIDENTTRKALSSDTFGEYVMALRKYKQNGYYAIGGRDIERFLNWWLTF